MSIFRTVSPMIRTQKNIEFNEQNKQKHYNKTTNNTINSYYTACTIWGYESSDYSRATEQCTIDNSDI